LSNFVTSNITIMNTRLKQFIAAENITQAQLADTINVVRASVSHILAGRNKPSYEFICGLMSHYPNLNMEWLMFGKGKMYKNPPAEQQSIMPEQTAELFPTPDHVDFKEQNGIADEPVQTQPGVSLTEVKALINSMQTPVNQRKLIKITAFYDDGTFQELTAN